MLTVNQALLHIKHFLARPLSERLDPLDVVNRVGHHLCNSYGWNWLGRREALLDFERGATRIVLPPHMAELESIEPVEADGPRLRLTTREEVQRRRGLGIDNTDNRSLVGAVGYDEDLSPVIELDRELVTSSYEDRRNRFFSSSEITDGSADPGDPFVWLPVVEDRWVFGCDNDNGKIGNSSGQYYHNGGMGPGNPVHPLNLTVNDNHSWASKTAIPVDFPANPIGSTHPLDKVWLIQRSIAATPGNAGCVRHNFYLMDVAVADPNNPGPAEGENSPHPTGFFAAQNTVSIYTRRYNSDSGFLTMTWRNGVPSQPTLWAQWTWDANGDLVLNPDGPVEDGGDGSVFADPGNRGIISDVLQDYSQGAEEVPGHPGWWRVWLSAKGTTYGVSFDQANNTTPRYKVRQCFFSEQAGFFGEWVEEDPGPPVVPAHWEYHQAGDPGGPPELKVSYGNFFFGPQLEDNGPLPSAYQPTDGHELRANGVDKEVMRLTYRARWTDVDADTQRLTIPAFMEPYYLQLLSAYARALQMPEQYDFNEMAAAIEAGPVAKAAKRSDSMIQGSYGQPERGMIWDERMQDYGSGGYSERPIIGGPE